MALSKYVIPLAELSGEERQVLRDKVEAVIVSEMLKKRIVTIPDEIVVRDLVVGDKANAADFVDLDVLTAVVTGQQHWAQDANDLTDNSLSSILASGEKVPDDKIIIFYGFYDRTPNPDLVSLQFKRGETVMGFWHTQHCYVRTDEIPGGMAKEPVIYYPNDPIDVRMCFVDGTVDKEVGMYALIAEKRGEIIA